MVLSGLIAFWVALAGIWLLERWAPRWRLVDRPDASRKTHGRAKPLAGAALALGALGAWWALNPSRFALAWTLGGLALLVLGLDDDLHRRSPGWKLVAQLGVALGVASSGGASVERLALGGLTLELGALALPLTVLWLVALTNAFNLIDGSDGLAVGQAVLSALALLGLFPADAAGGALGGALVGSGLAFWGFNRPPARAFLGDGGSYFLGFTLAVLSVRAADPFPPAPMALLFLVPLGDTAFAVVRRLRAGRSIFAADHDHVHHRLERRFGAWPMLGVLYAVALGGIGLAWGIQKWWR